MAGNFAHQLIHWQMIPSTPINAMEKRMLLLINNYPVPGLYVRLETLPCVFQHLQGFPDFPCITGMGKK